MFTTVALIISYILFKLGALTVLAILFLWFFLVAALFSYSEDGYLSVRFNRKKYPFWATIAFLLCIPYWNNVYDSRLANWGYEVLQESWQEHIVEGEKDPIRTNVATELRRYELLTWNPPKHFYVTLEDTVTHQVFNSIYVSKHCNAAYSLNKGEEYNIKVTSYTMSDKPGVILYEFHNLSSVFC